MSGTTMTRTIKFIGILALVAMSIIVPVSADLTTFDDYQFATDTQIQAHSWVFDLTVKQAPWSITGRVLTYRFYDVNASEPVNYISPTDIFIGTGPLYNGADQYNMSYSWGDRYINISFVSPSQDVPTILANLGNIHCIARDRDTLTAIKSVVNGSTMTLSGYLVDVTGFNTTGQLFWQTATTFGTKDCEILVISSAVPADVTANDLMIVYIVIIAIVASASVSIVIHRFDKKRCAVPTKTVGKIGKKT
jgi:hypothetical protein